jgi:hypothetical protein
MPGSCNHQRGFHNLLREGIEPNPGPVWKEVEKGVREKLELQRLSEERMNTTMKELEKISGKLTPGLAGPRVADLQRPNEHFEGCDPDILALAREVAGIAAPQPTAGMLLCSLFQFLRTSNSLFSTLSHPFFGINFPMFLRFSMFFVCLFVVVILFFPFWFSIETSFSAICLFSGDLSFLVSVCWSLFLISFFDSVIISPIFNPVYGEGLDIYRFVYSLVEQYVYFHILIIW